MSYYNDAMTEYRIQVYYPSSSNLFGCKLDLGFFFVRIEFGQRQLFFLASRLKKKIFGNSKVQLLLLLLL